MLGEKCAATGELVSIEHGTFWAYSYGFYNTYMAAKDQRLLLSLDVDQCYAIGGPAGAPACYAGWASHHPQGINFVYCDGSATSISTDVDIDLFCKMATIAGGETIDAE